LHSVPTRLAGTEDTILQAPDWPLGLTGLLPALRPGRVAVRWRGHLDIDKLLDLFGSAIGLVRDRPEHITATAMVVTGDHLERLPDLSGPTPVLDYVAEHGAEFLRIEDAADRRSDPSVVAWINHDAAPLDAGAESQQAAGVEVPVGDAQSIIDCVAQAVSFTRPPEDAPESGQNEKEVVRHVIELMGDITEVSGANLGRSG
jgi:hypothetical protein